MKKCIIEDRHEKHGENSEKCFMCHKVIGLSFEQKLKNKVDLVPDKTKQKLLDYLHEGMTVGEAEKKAGITDTLVGGEIIVQNIGNIKYLRKEINPQTK